MSSTPWQIDGHVARLHAGELHAVVDLCNPAAGLLIEQVAGAAKPGLAFALFQIPLNSGGSSCDPASLDFFVRGGDLVAVYAETPARPLRAEIYWRFLAGGEGPERATGQFALPAIELILSVQTSRLQMDPALAIGTALSADLEPLRKRPAEKPAEKGTVPFCSADSTKGDSPRPFSEVWRLSDPESGQFAASSQEDLGRLLCELTDTEIWFLSDLESGQFEANSLDGKRQLVFEPEEGLGCFLFRGDFPYSYLEMVHPADFRQMRLDCPAAASSGWRLEHRLFESAAGGLEKGVILRSRLRGLFLSREGDLATAAAEYRRFTESEPPLTV